MDVDSDEMVSDADYNLDCNSSNNEPIVPIVPNVCKSVASQKLKLIAVVMKPWNSPSDQDSPSHILKSLNDHCLYEAFKRLHFLDLLNVVKVCMRFEAQAKEAFASKYKKLELDIRQCDRNTMESILSTFGSSIQKLRVDSNKNEADGDLVHAITQNCSSDLKQLCLVSLNFILDAPNLRLPFPKLEELDLIDCAGNHDLAHLIDECPNLKRICIKYCDLRGVNEMIGRRFEKLEELQISKCDVDIETDALEHFIVSNPALIKLTITQYATRKRIRTSHAIRLIGQNMLKLQRLKILLSIEDLQHFQSDAEYIGRLHSLKYLALKFNGMKVAPLADALATNNVPIETLKIVRGSIDDNAIKSISKLKQLTALNIQHPHGCSEEHLIILAINLRGLQEMTLHSVINQDEHDVLTIDGLMQIVHYAKKLSQLLLFLDDNDDEDGNGGVAAAGGGYAGGAADDGGGFDDGANFTIDADHYKTMVNSIKNRREKIGLHIDIYSSILGMDVPEALQRENSDILSIR